VTARLCNHRNVAPVSRPAVARASTPAFVHEQLPNHTAKVLVMNYRNAPSLATAGKLELIALAAVILTPIVSFGQAVLSARRPACRKDNLLTPAVRLQRTHSPGRKAPFWMVHLPGKPSGHSVQ
jgi:hypothetical protein